MIAFITSLKVVNINHLILIKNIMGVVIEHFENGFIEFKDKTKFTSFVKKIYEENEKDSDIILNKIRNYSDAIYYMRNYCGNFKLVKF
jgi:hypothetical protein